MRKARHWRTRARAHARPRARLWGGGWDLPVVLGVVELVLADADQRLHLRAQQRLDNTSTRTRTHPRTHPPTFGIFVLSSACAGPRPSIRQPSTSWPSPRRAAPAPQTLRQTLQELAQRRLRRPASHPSIPNPALTTWAPTRCRASEWPRPRHPGRPGRRQPARAASARAAATFSAGAARAARAVQRFESKYIDSAGPRTRRRRMSRVGAPGCRHKAAVFESKELTNCLGCRHKAALAPLASSSSFTGPRRRGRGDVYLHWFWPARPPASSGSTHGPA